LVFVAILFYLIKNAKPGFFDENRYGKVELFCLAPISFIYFIRHRSEIKAIEEVTKQEEKIRFTDLTLGTFVFLIALSTLEMLMPTDEVVRRLQSGQLKPSWALVDFIVLLLSPYKEILYIATVSIGIIWLFLSIYKKWRKRKK
jgi:uncharacterized membrane protein YhaH (DUF805 family)